jgi:hypothetical protein
MPNRAIRQPLAADAWLPDAADDFAPPAPRLFALLLLGLAAALILAAAGFPEFFAGGVNSFGPDAL